mmetsp:Transcript_100738/g.285203  ORF Transcript_100738/g.285203 Transcript_100738/m.285203 type:complete len:89 (+) Transcript_100738:1084-1350(+)
MPAVQMLAIVIQAIQEVPLVLRIYVLSSLSSFELWAGRFAACSPVQETGALCFFLIFRDLVLYFQIMQWHLQGAALHLHGVASYFTHD